MFWPLKGRGVSPRRLRTLQSAAVISDLPAPLLVPSTIRGVGRNVLLTALKLPFCDHLCCGTFGNAGILRVVAEGPWAKSVTESVRAAAIERSSELVAQAVSIANDNGGAFRGFGTSEGNLLLPGCFTGISGMGLALLDQLNRDDRLGTLLTLGLLSPAGAVAPTPVHQSAANTR